MTSRVIPHEVRRQGLDQENPCPGDMVEFTCTRSEASPAAVRWTADEMPLYTHFIPQDINSANQSSIPGLIGVLVNETKLTLLVDLNTSTRIINNTGITCGEVLRDITSQTINLMTIGMFTNY